MRVLAAGFILVGLLAASVPVSATTTDLHPADTQTCSLVNVPTCELANLQPETSEPEPPNPEIADLRQAAYYYNRYHDLAPDDLLLGLKHLTETCTALENAGVEDENCREVADRLLWNAQYALRDSDSNAASPTALSPAAVLRDALAARTDDRRIVAELLNVPVEEVELGTGEASGRTGRSEGKGKSFLGWSERVRFGQAICMSTIICGDKAWRTTTRPTRRFTARR